MEATHPLEDASEPTPGLLVGYLPERCAVTEPPERIPARIVFNIQGPGATRLSFVPEASAVIGAEGKELPADFVGGSWGVAP